jgi:hypothetical protein
MIYEWFLEITKDHWTVCFHSNRYAEKRVTDRHKSQLVIENIRHFDHQMDVLFSDAQDEICGRWYMEAELFVASVGDFNSAVRGETEMRMDAPFSNWLYVVKYQFSGRNDEDLLRTRDKHSDTLSCLGKNVTSLSDATKSDRVAEFQKLIRLDDIEGPIDLSELRRYLLLPFPDDHPGLRFYNWQLSFCILPPRTRTVGVNMADSRHPIPGPDEVNIPQYFRLPRLRSGEWEGSRMPKNDETNSQRCLSDAPNPAPTLDSLQV